MRLLIWQKLFLTLFGAIVTVVFVALLLTRWTFNQGFLDYLNALEEERIEAIALDLTTIYTTTGTWKTIGENPELWRNIMLRNSRGDQFEPQDSPPNRPTGPLSGRAPKPSGGRFIPPDPRGRRGMFPPAPGGPLGMRQPIDLLDENRNVVVGRPDTIKTASFRALKLGERTIGFLRYVPLAAVTELNAAAERRFIEQQRNSLYWIALLVIVISITLGLLLGRELVKPIKQLVSGTKALAAGQLNRRIKSLRSDELGQLADDLNAMAASLEASRNSQQQWLVDIAHELRTPLAILKGELLALDDGIRVWSDEALESLQTEVARLTNLVNDIREITLSDAGGMGYQWSAVDLREIVGDVVHSFRHELNTRNLTIETMLMDSPALLLGDARRLEQVLINLLQNSCRYTDAGGLIRITLVANHGLTLRVSDTAPAAPTEALPRLFDRLYRAETSRNRNFGGSGLGLAICKGIVEAHGGTISARHAELGGLEIVIELPIKND